MTLPTVEGTGYSPSETWAVLRQQAHSAMVVGQASLTTLQTSSVNTGWVFNLLDQLRVFIALLNTWGGVSGLNSYATAQGYGGTLTNDITACKNAAQACIDGDSLFDINIRALAAPCRQRRYLFQDQAGHALTSACTQCSARWRSRSRFLTNSMPSRRQSTA